MAPSGPSFTLSTWGERCFVVFWDWGGLVGCWWAVGGAWFATCLTPTCGAASAPSMGATLTSNAPRASGLGGRWCVVWCGGVGVRRGWGIGTGKRTTLPVGTWFGGPKNDVAGGDVVWWTKKRRCRWGRGSVNRKTTSRERRFLGFFGGPYDVRRQQRRVFILRRPYGRSRGM